MPPRLEHANITVADVDAMISFLKCVEPSYEVLHDSGTQGAYRWVHLGKHSSYFALEEPHETPARPSHRTRYADFGINHIGLVVEDVTAIASRLTAAGYVEGHKAEVHPARIRRYFEDPCGGEWEFVQYLAEAPDARFSYRDAW